MVKKIDKAKFAWKESDVRVIVKSVQKEKKTEVSGPADSSGETPQKEQ